MNSLDLSLLPIVSDIMQIVTGVAAAAIAIIVLRHNRRSDKEALRERAWASQQQLNYIALQNPEVMKAAEFTVRASTLNDMTDEDLRRAIYTTFIQLNGIHLLWNGSRSGILSPSEVEDEVRPTLTLISGNQQLLKYCLTRGYSEAYQSYVQAQILGVQTLGQLPEDSHEALSRLRKAVSDAQEKPVV